MKRFLYSLIVCIFFANITYAQTWTGNTSTDWNTASNWNPASLPTAGTTATIPTTPAGNRWPVLASGVTVSSLVMAAGSQINTNSYPISAGSIDVRGTFNNTDVGSDITITVTGASTSYIRNSVFNDNVQINIQGTATFYDNFAAGTASTYNGNVNYQRSGIGPTYIGYYARNTYTANVFVQSSIVALLDIFNAGATVGGNLNVISAGGNLNIGNEAVNTTIGGMLNVAASESGTFSLHRLINQTAGGAVVATNRSTADISRDTIKANVSVQALTAGFSLDNNSIVGNIVYSTTAGNASTAYVRGNVVTGTADYTIAGTQTFYDNFSASTANSYSGNVVYNRTATGNTYVSYYARNTYGGNVTLNASNIANVDFSNFGADINGNLSITSVGGSCSIGNVNYNTLVGGTLQINASESGNFSLSRLINQTAGGSVTVTKRAAVNVERDTIKVSLLKIVDQSTTLQIDNNSIVGNLQYESSVSNTSTSFVRANQITGNASYTLNGTHTFYDTYSGSTQNTYTGDVVYTRNSTGTTYVGYYSRNTYGGNVTVNSLAVAILSAFEAGANIAGNFSLTSSGGATTIGTAAQNTLINGTVSIAANVSGNFSLKRVINQTAGGTIGVNTRAVVELLSDTLKTDINIVDNTAGLAIDNNQITGNLYYNSPGANASTLYVRNNYITGNAQYILNGTGTFYDTFGGNTRNFYTGNVSYVRTSTTQVYVGYYDTVNVGGDLTFNLSLPGTVTNNYISFFGSGPSNLEQNGTIPLQFERLSMKKTGAGALTLKDSLRIDNQVYFNGGVINTSNQNELIWLNNALSVTPGDASHVKGPVVKIGDDAFRFPLGSGSSLQSVAMTIPSGVTTRFRGEYFPANPHPTYDTSQRAAGLAAISACEYWKIDREVGTTNVTLTFDYGGPCLCVEQPANLRVARWNAGTTQWVSEGNGAVSGGLEGTIQTGAAVAQYGVFSLGSSATIAPTVSISRDVANPVCVCRRVTFTATPSTAGCNPSYQWKKNGVNVGTNSASYSDSALVNGDAITVVISSSAAFASPATATSNGFSITTTDINTWAGSTNTSWHTASNWTCQSVPCVLSKVTVPTTANACEILSGNVQVISLTANPGATVRVLNGSTITLKQP